nr:uncharacterized protein CFP56_22552 [Quercus suber]
MTEQKPELARHKRIILCADGTWLASDLGHKAVPSNVAKIARAIAANGTDADGNIVRQIVSYHSGLGTGDLPFQKAIYGGIGWGLDNDICQIYDFISNNYEPDDELFFFGFSRGAYTVRSVASLVCDIGVLPAIHMDQFPAMWEAYRANTNGLDFKSSSWYSVYQPLLNLKEVKVKVIGVWDTVGALGIPEWPVVKHLDWPPDVEYAFQALAIDEKRLTFLPALWHRTANAPAKDLQQCWFPGIHGNIGGQYDEQKQEIGDNTLAWMIDNLSGMLTFEKGAIDVLIKHHQTALKAIRPPIANGWGCGKITDNFAGLQGIFFQLLGRQDRTPGAYLSTPGDGVAGATNETFHPTVRIRLDKVSTWRPKSLEGFVHKEPLASHAAQGWTWVKEGVQPIPEYIMRPEKTLHVAIRGANGTVKYRHEKSLARALCPTDVLLELDEANGFTGLSAVGESYFLR